MAESESPAPRVEPDVAEVRIEAGGRPWIVTVLGRSGGTASGATPLLLLGFTPADTAARVSLEALVVGRTLEGVSKSALIKAHASASPHEPANVADRSEGKAVVDQA